MGKRRPSKKMPAAPAMMTTQEVDVLIEALRSDFKFVVEGQTIIKDDVATLKERVDSLTGMVAKSATDITYLKIEIANIHHELTTINGKLSRMEGKLDQGVPSDRRPLHRIRTLTPFWTARKGRLSYRMTNPERRATASSLPLEEAHRPCLLNKAAGEKFAK